MKLEFTFEVDVRLLGGNTPEMRAKDKDERVRALAAKREVYGMCYREKEGQWAEPKDVTLEIPLTSSNLSDLFTFGRILGRVFVDDVDIMDNLIEKGLAKKR